MIDYQEIIEQLDDNRVMALLDKLGIPYEDKTDCLVKIDSNLGHGVMIGDCGILFAFISKDDIKSGNFENAIVDWDCC